MSKWLIAEQSVRGSLILFFGNALSTAFSAAAVILIARLLGPGGYGAYTLSLVISSIFLLIFGLGVNVAITRYSAQQISIGNLGEAMRFTRNGIVFLVSVAVVLTITNYFVAAALASSIFLRPELTFYVQQASISILASALVQSVTAASIGWNMMGLASFTQIGQSLAKLILAPFLILVGFGLTGAIAGQVSSSLLAGLLASTAFYFVRLRGLKGSGGRFLSDVREMIRFGFPAYVGLLVIGLASYYVTVLLALIANNSVVGFYQAAANITAPILLISVSIANSLFPAFSRLEGVGADTSAAFRLAVKYVSLIMTPVILFTAASSDSLVEALYGTSFLPSAFYLRLLAAAYLPVAIGYGVISGFFNGVGRTKLTMVFYLVVAISLGALAPLLSTYLSVGVPGLIYAILASNSIATVIGLRLASSYLQAYVDVKSLLMVFSAAALSYLATMFIPAIHLPAAISLGLYLLVFFPVYMTLIPLLKGIRLEDIERLNAALGEIRYVGPLASLILRYEQYLMAIRGATK